MKHINEKKENLEKIYLKTKLEEINTREYETSGIIFSIMQYS